jgi:hypothetical protein
LPSSYARQKFALPTYLPTPATLTFSTPAGGICNLPSCPPMHRRNPPCKTMNSPLRLPTKEKKWGAVLPESSRTIHTYMHSKLVYAGGNPCLSLACMGQGKTGQIEQQCRRRVKSVFLLSFRGIEIVVNEIRAWERLFPSLIHHRFLVGYVFRK